MEKERVDYTLVPLGLGIMVAYHLWLLHRVMKHPANTIIGVNAITRRFWVQAMMEDVSKNGVLAVQTLRNNIMASTLLASTAIMLSSVIAVLMTNGNNNSNNNTTLRSPSFFVVYGDKSEMGMSIKFFSILVCFLSAFLFNVQSIRYYSHASILINVPFKKNIVVDGGSSSQSQQHHLQAEAYVVTAVNKGGYFWSVGLRAFYFSLPLFLWIFGPIPMFLCSVVLVSMLYFLDVTLEFGWAVRISDDANHTKNQV